MNRRGFLGGTALLLGRNANAATPALAFEHARIHPGDGRRLDDATLLVQGDRIAALGPDVVVPADARRVDARGAWITPGLFDAEAETGLTDVDLEQSTVERGLDEHYDAVRAAFSVIDGFNPRAVNVPITRAEGVTAVALAARGGLVAGRGAVVHLSGARINDLLLRGPSAVYANLAAPGRAAGFGARGGALLRLRELFDDVRQYRDRRADFERNQMRRVAASRLDLEALIPVIGGQLPLVVEAHRASDIQAALAFAGSQKIRLILSGCEEGWVVAAEIAAAQIPVICSALPNLPRSFESLAARLENAALLSAAGVQVALSPRAEDVQGARTLRFQAGNAVAQGLPWETALAAITRVPAQLFGVADRVGTLLPGQSADVVVWSGDPFEPLHRPRRILIGGRDLSLVTRQTLLRDRYRR